MAGRDQDFQRELRAREEAAREAAAGQSERQQAIANALANRTLTEITLQGVEVFLLRMVNDEEEFQGVTLAFVDRAFNKRYTYVMNADSVQGFHHDLGVVISGKEEFEASQNGEVPNDE